MFSKMKLRLAVHSGLKRLANHVTLVSSHENAPKYQSQRLLGGTPLYKLHRYLRPQSGWFFSLSDVK